MQEASDYYTIPFLGQLDLLQTCLGIFLMDSNQVIRIEVGCSLTMCRGTGGGMLEDRTIVELTICLSQQIILSGILWRKNQGCYGNQKFSLFELHSLSKCLVWVRKCCHVWLDQNFDPSLLTKKLVFI